MTEKTYKGSTNVCLNIVLPGGANMHVSFTPQSNGSSVFTTANEDVQKGLEHHYKFGKLFRVIAERDPEEEAKKAAKAKKAEKAVEEEAASALRKVKMTDYDSAKDYLAENYSVSRTSLRTKKSIEECAAQHGIEFVIG